MAAFTLTRPSTGTVSPDVKRVDGEGFDFPTFSLVNKQSRVSVSPNPLPINNALTYSLFSISNVLGCFSAAIVTTSGPAIVLSSLSDLRKAVREATSPYEAKCTIHLQERAQHLAFTSTGARLFVGLESGAVLVFDVAKALADGHAEPLRSIPGPPLRSIVPNPNQESGTCDLVAFTRRDDGTAVVLDGQFQSQALFHPSDNACAVSSVSWSPKGKQLAVATRTAGIFTFTLPNPSKYQQYIPPTSPQVLATLNWLSPGHTFRVTYSPERDGSGDQLGDPVQQVLYWDSKTSKLTLYETMHPYANHDRPLQNSYYAGLPYYDEAEKGIEVLGKRFLMVVADPSSIDLEILATDSVRWYQASQENQLSLPLAQTGNDDDDDAGDSIPLFLGMDLTDADGGVPVMFVYLNDGTVQAWSVRPSRPYIGIVKPNAITSTSTSTLAPPPPLATAMSTTADPAPASSPPPAPSFGGTSAFGSQAGFGQSTFGTSGFGGQSSFASSAFGQSSSAFGQSPTNSSASTTAFSQITPTPSTSVFGQSSFGQSPSSFGQSTFGQPSSFGQAKQSPFGSSTGNVSGGFGAFANSSSGGFGSSAPQTQTGFGGSGAFGATSSTPAGFGGSAFGSGSNPQTSAFGSSSPVPASQEQGMDTAESVPDSEDEGGGGFGGLSLGKQPGSDANTRPGIFGVPATPAAQPSQSAFGGGGSASVIRSGSGAFGGVGMSGGAFGGSSISSSGGAFSGGSGTAWGSAATTSPTSGSGFGQSSFGSKPAFGQPAFGQSGFGAKPAITPSISSTSISGGGFSSFASQNPPEMKRGAPLTGGFAGFASGTSAFGSPAVKPALATVDKLDETMASVSASASPFGSSSPAGTSSPDGPFGSSSNVSPFKQPSPPSLSSDAQPKSTESPSTADSGAQNTTTDESSPASSLSFGKTTGERMFGGDASSISTPTGKEEATATISEPVATAEVKEEEKSPDLKTSEPAVLATPEKKSIFGAGQTPPPSSIFGKSSTTPGGGSFFGKSFASPASPFGKSTPSTPSGSAFSTPTRPASSAFGTSFGQNQDEDREDSPPPSSGQRKKHAILESPTSSPEATPKVGAASLPSSKTATSSFLQPASGFGKLASSTGSASAFTSPPATPEKKVSAFALSGDSKPSTPSATASPMFGAPTVLGSGFKSVFSAPKPGASPLPTPASPPRGGFGSFSQKSAFGDVSASKTSFADLLQKDAKDGKRVPVFSPPEKVKEEPKEEVLPKEEPTTPPLPDEPAEPGSTSSSFVDVTAEEVRSDSDSDDDDGEPLDSGSDIDEDADADADSDANEESDFLSDGLSEIAEEDEDAVAAAEAQDSAAELERIAALPLPKSRASSLTPSEGSTPNRAQSTTPLGSPTKLTPAPVASPSPSGSSGFTFVQSRPSSTKPIRSSPLASTVISPELAEDEPRSGKRARVTPPPLSKPSPPRPSTSSPKPSGGFNWTAAGLAKPSTTGWKCGLCQVQNSEDQEKCVSCESAKPSVAAASSSPPAKKPLTPSGGNGFNWSAAGIAKPTATPDQWKCPTCLISNSNDKSKCSACESERPAPATTPTSAPPAPASAPKFVAGGFDWSASGMSKPVVKSDDWKCSACLCTNPVDAEKCKVCETTKPGATTASTSTASAPAPTSSIFTMPMAPATPSFSSISKVASTPPPHTPSTTGLFNLGPSPLTSGLFGQSGSSASPQPSKPLFGGFKIPSPGQSASPQPPAPSTAPFSPGGFKMPVAPPVFGAPPKAVSLPTAPLGPSPGGFTMPIASSAFSQPSVAAPPVGPQAGGFQMTMSSPQSRNTAPGPLTAAPFTKPISSPSTPLAPRVSVVPSPTSPSAAIVEEGMQLECANLIREMEQDLAALRQLSQGVTNEREVYRRSCGATTIHDAVDPKKWGVIDSKVLHGSFSALERDLDELEIMKSGWGQEMKKIRSVMLKVEIRREEISRFREARSDQGYMDMLKTRSLGPELEQTQSKLRKDVRSVRRRIEKLEADLQVSKKKLSEMQTGTDAAKPITLDKIEKTFQTISECIARQEKELNELRRKVGKIPLKEESLQRLRRRKQQDSSPQTSRPNAKSDMLHRVQANTAAALNAERSAQKLKQALLAIRSEPLLNRQVLSVSAPLAQALGTSTKVQPVMQGPSVPLFAGLQFNSPVFRSPSPSDTRLPEPASSRRRGAGVEVQKQKQHSASPRFPRSSEHSAAPVAPSFDWGPLPPIPSDGTKTPSKFVSFTKP